MKVLHLPIGRQMIEMCASLRGIGIDAVSCHFRQRTVPLKSDLCLHFERLSSEQRKKLREQFLAEAAKQYDVFHFHFGKTFLKDRSDLKYLKKLGKKLVVQHRGSDVRMLSIARKNGNPHVRVKGGRSRSEDTIIANLKEISAYIDHAIVADHELLSYVNRYYKKVHLLRQFVTLDKFIPSYPSLTKSRPLIIHAPTHTYLKGTEFILKGINRLKKKGLEFDFKLIENMTHQEAIKRYREADIIIDQLLQGSFGVFSLEGMALGKPVICFIREELQSKYPPGLPVVNANPATFYEILKQLVKDPNKRYQQGLAGRKYIEQYYDSRLLSKELVNIYHQL